MEVALTAKFFAALLAPILVPLFVMIASANRWVYAASLVVVPAGLVLVVQHWLRDDPGPAGIAIVPLAAAAAAGWLIGAAVWLVNAIRQRSDRIPWQQVAILYAMASAFALAFAY